MNPRIRVAAVIIQDRRILLIRHQKTQGTYWLLPGGGVDYGETLPQALTREVKEETGLDIKVGQLLFVSDAIEPNLKRHIVNIFFQATVHNGEVKLGEEEVLREVKFCDLSSLSNLTLFPNIKEELTGFANSQTIVSRYLGQKWEWSQC